MSALQGFDDLVSAFATSNAHSLDGTTTTGKIGQWLNDLTGASATNQFTHDEALLARQFASAEAQRAFTRELHADNTKYQRSMQDLKDAGINPILAVQGLNAGSVSAPAATSGAVSGASGAGATIISAITRGLSQIVSSAIRAAK